MEVLDRRTLVVRRALLAACLALAPVVIALASAIDTSSAETPAGEWDALVSDRGDALASAYLFALGGALLVPGSIGIAQLLRARGSGLLTTGAAMVGVGGLAIALGAFSFSTVAYLLTEAQVPRDTGRAVFETADGDAVVDLPWMLGMAALLGFVVVGAALLRVRATAPWKGALLVVAPFAAFLSPGDGWASLLSNLPLVVAVAFLADQVRRVGEVAEADALPGMPAPRAGADDAAASRKGPRATA